MHAGRQLYFAFHSLMSSEKSGRQYQDSGSPKDGQLSGLFKYALIHSSRASHLNYGTTCRPRDNSDHHYSHSRHLRLRSRAASDGSIAELSVAGYGCPAVSNGPAFECDGETSRVTRNSCCCSFGAGTSSPQPAATTCTDAGTPACSSAHASEVERDSQTTRSSLATAGIQCFRGATAA